MGRTVVVRAAVAAPAATSSAMVVPWMMSRRWCGWFPPNTRQRPSSWPPPAGRPSWPSCTPRSDPGLLPKVNLSPTRQLFVVVGHLVTPTARLPIPLTPELYTANPPYIDFIRRDRLRLLEATTRFFWETARLDRQRGRVSARLNLPLLVLQGEDDKMMDVAKTRRWFSRLSVEDRTYVAYPGAGHTLDFEPDRARYLADMLAWLSDRLPSGSSWPTGGGP